MIPPPKRLALPSPEQWASSLGLDLSNKVFRALLVERDKVGEENFRLAYSMFLTGMISAFVAVVLRQKPADEVLYSPEELMKFAENNFVNVKAMLQTSVANGVQTGVLSWSGQQIDYYCLIKPIPGAINEQPC